MFKHLVHRGIVWFVLIASMLGFGSGSVPDVQAAPVAWPSVQLQFVTNGISSPTSITYEDAHPGWLYVTSQQGTVRLLKDGVLQSTPFLDIQTQVSCCGERGLLGLVFPRGYASKLHFYVDYTNTNGDIVVARYTVNKTTGLVNTNSRVVVMTIAHSKYANHNGGQLAFGKDGYLYIGVGDGGSEGDPDQQGQNRNTMLAKILRIDVEGNNCVSNPPHSPNYCVPASNPYAKISGVKHEIWAYGLRNPWKFSFDRGTGNLYIADVGQDVEEEIDFQLSTSKGGNNYGWSILEGVNCYRPASGCTNPASYVPPVATYDHGNNDANGCAVVGGNVYHGPDKNPAMLGVYFYGDYCKGTIYGLKNDGDWQSQSLVTAPFMISTFGEDFSGNIYVGDYNGGAIYLLQDQQAAQFANPNLIYLPNIVQ